MNALTQPVSELFERVTATLTRRDGQGLRDGADDGEAA
jgi:hypothetical protein